MTDPIGHVRPPPPGRFSNTKHIGGGMGPGAPGAQQMHSRNFPPRSAPSMPSNSIAGRMNVPAAPVVPPPSGPDTFQDKSNFSRYSISTSGTGNRNFGHYVNSMLSHQPTHNFEPRTAVTGSMGFPSSTQHTKGRDGVLAHSSGSNTTGSSSHMYGSSYGNSHTPTTNSGMAYNASSTSSTANTGFMNPVFNQSHGSGFNRVANSSSASSGPNNAYHPMSQHPSAKEGIHSGITANYGPPYNNLPSGVMYPAPSATAFGGHSTMPPVGGTSPSTSTPGFSNNLPSSTFTRSQPPIPESQNTYNGPFDGPAHCSIPPSSGLSYNGVSRPHPSNGFGNSSSNIPRRYGERSVSPDMHKFKPPTGTVGPFPKGIPSGNFSVHPRNNMYDSSEHDSLKPTSGWDVRPGDKSVAPPVPFWNGTLSVDKSHSDSRSRFTRNSPGRGNMRSRSISRTRVDRFKSYSRSRSGSGNRNHRGVTGRSRSPLDGRNKAGRPGLVNRDLRGGRGSLRGRQDDIFSEGVLDNQRNAIDISGRNCIDFRNTNSGVKGEAAPNCYSSIDSRNPNESKFGMPIIERPNIDTSDPGAFAYGRGRGKPIPSWSKPGENSLAQNNLLEKDRPPQIASNIKTYNSEFSDRSPIIINPVILPPMVDNKYQNYGFGSSATNDFTNRNTHASQNSIQTNSQMPYVLPVPTANNSKTSIAMAQQIPHQFPHAAHSQPQSGHSMINSGTGYPPSQQQPLQQSQQLLMQQLHQPHNSQYGFNNTVPQSCNTGMQYYMPPQPITSSGSAIHGMTRVATTSYSSGPKTSASSTAASHPSQPSAVQNASEGMEWFSQYIDNQAELTPSTSLSCSTSTPFNSSNTTSTNSALIGGGSGGVNRSAMDFPQNVDPLAAQMQAWTEAWNQMDPQQQMMYQQYYQQWYMQAIQQQQLAAQQQSQVLAPAQAYPMNINPWMMANQQAIPVLTAEQSSIGNSLNKSHI